MSEPRHTVLVVEDDEAIRLSLQMFFEEEGYVVVPACNGMEALAHLEASSIPVCFILLDLFMPVMDGVEFLDKLKLNGDHAASKIPVVVVSAAPPDGPMALKIKEQADQFVRKPASLDHLAKLAERYCPLPRV